MKIYLDMCSLQRPLDDQRQIRIATETEAILGVLSLWEAGKIALIGSEALHYEARYITQPERASYMAEILNRIKTTIIIHKTVEQRAAFFEKKGIKPLDALHLACAENEKVDYFCTCDDKFFKKAKNLPSLKIKVVSPLELVTKLSS